MRMEEYLHTVTDQIRCRNAREMVSEELRNHILDQAEAYEAEGVFEDEALERAVRDMGDPVEVGISMDRIHRPRMSAGILLLTAAISLMSIALHAVLPGYSEDLAESGIGYLKNVIMYNVYGYILMLLVYRLDYTFLAGHGKKMAAAFLIFLYLGSILFGTEVNGRLMYLRLSGFYILISAFVLLYVPLFGAVLYAYRGKGYFALGKLFLWAVLPLVFVFRLPSLNLTLVLAMSFACLFTAAVWKGWYQVDRRKTLAVLWGGVLTAPAVLMTVLYVSGNLQGYQAARIHAFLSRDPDYNYITNTLARFLGSSHLLGRSEINMLTLAENIPGFNSDFVFVSLISAYGILAGVLAAVLLVFLIAKIFRVSFRQKNQLGMILGAGCGLVFLFQVLLNLAVNLCLIPVTSGSLPFFSAGGSGTMVSYILLGLVLSVYRYKDIQKERFRQDASTVG